MPTESPIPVDDVNLHEQQVSPHSTLLKDPRFIVAATAGALIASGVAGGLLLNRLRNRKLGQEDPLLGAIEGEMDVELPDRDQRSKEGITGALLDPSLPDGDRDSLTEVLDALHAREQGGMGRRVPSIRGMVRRVFDSSSRVGAFVDSMSRLRRWKRLAHDNSVQPHISEDKGLADALMVARVASGLETLEQGFSSEGQIELRKKLLARGNRVFRPNTQHPNPAEWRAIDSIAQSRWLSPTLRSARHGITQGAELTPNNLAYSDGWLMHVSADGRVLGYASYVPVEHIDPEHDDLSEVSFEDLLARRANSLRSNTMLVTAVQQSYDAKSSDPSASLLFALQDIAYMSGAENVVSASLSPSVKVRQMRDARSGIQPRLYQEYLGEDKWNNVVSAFSATDHDLGFNPHFMNVALPQAEVEDFMNAQHDQVVAVPSDNGQDIYLDQYPVPVRSDQDGYHVDVPATFKLLYSRETSYLPNTALGDRLQMTLFKAASPEKQR